MSMRHLRRATTTWAPTAISRHSIRGRLRPGHYPTYSIPNLGSRSLLARHPRRRRHSRTLLQPRPPLSRSPTAAIRTLPRQIAGQAHERSHRMLRSARPRPTTSVCPASQRLSDPEAVKTRRRSRLRTMMAVVATKMKTTTTTAPTALPNATVSISTAPEIGSPRNRTRPTRQAMQLACQSSFEAPLAHR